MIPESDARNIISLLGRVALMESSRNDRRTALLNGLSKLVGADAWLWFTAAHTIAGDPPAHAVVLKSGFSDEQMGYLIEASECPDMTKLTAPFFEDFEKTKGQTTRLRQQIDPLNFFDESAVYDLWKKANIGPVILSARPTSDGQVSMIGLYRNFDRPLFNEQDSRIAHIVLSEIPSLHEAISPAELNGEVTGLSPRLRQVLNLLLQGSSRKEIAAALSLSIHTVGDYVAELYRRFDVHSQTELVRRFLVGDGGDSP
ncbi:MAG: LuxR C-terminal-related transcriptional regulator [Verrucomicrobiales bacterium]|nr:LuxR C-terminal-related transcriptional regulator [Verrucomicrobiales bacterium]